MAHPIKKSNQGITQGFIIPVLIVSFMFLGCNTTSNDGGLRGKDGDWLIPPTEVVDGGPGKDGIPSIDNPKFLKATDVTFLADNRMVTGIKIGNQLRAYPHQIMDWHEIVNDKINDEHLAVNFCPLTGTSMAWNREIDGVVTEFGVSGLLFRNNLIPYDRETDSYWSQMQLRGVLGDNFNKEAEMYQVVETTWKTWKTIYPDSDVLSVDTGFSRNYSASSFAYGSDFTSNNSVILFPVTNRDDRLKNKERVHGIIPGGSPDFDTTIKVYRIKDFDDGIGVIEDRFSGTDYVIAGSSELDIINAFERSLNGQDLTFEPVQDRLPIVMEDNLGNQWDIFGFAVDGPNAGSKLTEARSYTGYWYGWVDFFPNTEIYNFEE